ncbi:hypothetical protein ACFYNZ_16410 [Streptomyces kebangsaanensis]|uniref:ATP-grasp-modified RiPP n=1 Tax=Streptomyces kebangsaanensis TaxID=864058 RepID=A0ABW6KT51_9ACTN
MTQRTDQFVGHRLILQPEPGAVRRHTSDTACGSFPGKELDSIIVGVGDDDPNPVSLPVGTITVEDPIVTNWHTTPADAVPSI